jgi:hypothetical protein
MKFFAKKSNDDPMDVLLAAAVLGELTPEEHAQFEFRLENDPAARAAYQETLHMHDLLEKNYRKAQPDPAFEERMVSGVRRKIRREETHRETAWESLGVLWRGITRILSHRWVSRTAFATAFVLVAGLSVQSYVRHTALLTGMSEQGGENPAGSSHFVPTKALAEIRVDEDTYTKAKAISSVATGAMPMVQATTAMDMPAPVVDMNAPDRTAKAAFAAPAATDSSAVPGARAEGGPDYLFSKQPLSPVSPAPGNIPAPSDASTQEPSRKLIRNAQLDLEVASFQKAVDDLTGLVKAGGGYVDSSNSQRGGNGKLQGTVVVKVLPENLDGFLLKLRDLGEIRNQAVSTDDVTRAYYDTQARLDNARRMETQLQSLLQRDNGKVSELLQVERELGRVRGEIEQMQGELKLYDFQVQYATVTISVQEKDLDQAAAYLLKETDDFSLFAHDVEAAFQQARQASDEFKGHVLMANLNHNSGSDVSATMVVAVPPEQIDGFVARVKTLGRIDNFTRQTQRVARDGGDTNQPADEAKTEKDRVIVNLTIRSDDETPRQQTQLSIVAGSGIEAMAQQLKQQAATPGVEVTASSFERQTDGRESAEMTFRLPMEKVPAFMETLKRLGRVESLSVHRDDGPDQGGTDDHAPAEITLQLHNEAALVAEDNGLWATLRRTSGEGIAAFLGSVKTIGVAVAFLLPWLVALTIVAWIGRRIYVARRK